MFFHEKTYDIDELAKWNLHLHTNFSRCAKSEMKARDIVKAADKAGLEMIALQSWNKIAFAISWNVFAFANTWNAMHALHGLHPTSLKRILP